MMPILLIDGNNLGHTLGFINKATGRYDIAGLITCLDKVARYLAAQGQETKIVLFLDDASAAERLGGWHVHVAPVPHGDADVAIRAYARAHSDHPQTLVSGDQALCGDAALWGAICLSPEAFNTRYLVLARQADLPESPDTIKDDSELRLPRVKDSVEAISTPQKPPTRPSADQGRIDRQLQTAALERTTAALRGKPLAAPEVFHLELSRWQDPVELALYLTEQHLCGGHHELTDPGEMILAIRQHCSQQPRYFTSGRIIDRVFRLFLCRPEHSLSLDALARLAQTRRRKIRAAIAKHGEQLGIRVAW